MTHYRLLFSQGNVFDEFDAETDTAAHKRGRDASWLLEVPTRVASDSPWPRSDFRLETQDRGRWVVIAGWVRAQRVGSP